ncbi:MAG: transaldolase [Lapillicoccus sp.]
MTNDNLQALSDAGVSIWLDDLSRDRLDSGNLAELVKVRNVVGVTTNPTIFQLALSKGNAYDDQLEKLAAAGKNVDEAVFEMTTDDVRSACDVMASVYEATDGVDGRVSIEVDPRLAHDTEQTVAQAKQLAHSVDRDNVLVKIPATLEGLPAITAVLADGISVNVTLIFSLERYRAVMNAFLSGLEQALQAGKDLAKIQSVASFFVSRVDTEIDKRLDAIGQGDENSAAQALKGKAGIANARLAYQAYEEVFSTSRWESLAAEGARPQRPLWASTGVKDPAYKDTMYVVDLVAPGIVNTMPEKTMDAVADHGEVTGDTITPNYADAQKVLDDLEAMGISYNDVVQVLEVEGVDKFEKSWGELLDEATADLQQAAEKAAQKAARR